MKILTALAILALASCSRDDRVAPADVSSDTSYRNVMWDGHKLIEWKDGYYSGLVHHPGCPCLHKDPWEGFVLPEEKSVDGVE